MAPIDYAIIAAYFAVMIGVGVYFMRRQSGIDEYFVGNRKMGAGHIGLSVVATDVGGGFSIGLGGLGFMMGLAGSWMLFSGLVGAWLTAVVLVPRIKELGDAQGWLTFPQYLEHRYDVRTRVIAAIVSGLAYAAFVGSQILAGATLVEGAFGFDKTTAVVAMSIVVIGYTTLGGLEAVVYTDTIQWAVLLGGLILFGVPFAWMEIGGWEELVAGLPEGHLSLGNIAALTFFSWMLTIVPIWFVANTLYQRIYAARSVASARRAWYMAGLLEWPVLAMLGAVLGMFGRVLFPEIPMEERELALPRLIKEVLPQGVTGVVVAVYLAAIMSTADSCLLASVGHFISDVYQRLIHPDASRERLLGLSRKLTLTVGLVSVSIAFLVPTVIEAILISYKFMSSGLLVPLLFGIFSSRTTSLAAFWSVLVGGGLAVAVEVAVRTGAIEVGDALASGLAVMIAMPASLLVMLALTALRPARR